MNTYNVKMPIVGYAIVEVEAENETDAIKAALDEVSSSDIEQWQAVEQISRGNILYADVNEITVQEV